MDRLAAHVIATAVLTAALAAVPTAMATQASAPKTNLGGRPGAAGLAAVPTASSGTSPTAPPTASSISAGAAATATPAAPSSSAPAAQTTPTPTPTPKPTTVKPILVHFPCPDTRQVGGTSYVSWHGATAFSVKQFYSPACHAVYGYAYPWLQFRQRKQNYDLGLGVFDVSHDAIVGARTFTGGAGGPDFWSAPFTVSPGTCSEALAHVFFPDTEAEISTGAFCQPF